MYDFDFVKPASVPEAVAALGREDAKALAGGQTLIPTLKQRLASPSVLVDLSGCLDDKCFVDRGGNLSISGGARHKTVAACADAPAGLRELAGMIGDPQVRNRGTIGGSLANNDPAACYPAAALALGARIGTDRRTIEADDFFQGMFTTALAEDEIITEVRVPTAATVGGAPVRASAYEKFVQPASRFALVGVFVARFDAGVRVAVTGASQEGVFRWSEAEAALSADFTPAAVEGLTVAADGMIGDIHGSPDYRAHLVGVMTRRAAARAR